MSDYLRTPLDIVAVPDGTELVLPRLTILEYPSRHEFNPPDIAAGVASLGLKPETLRRTQVYLQRGPLPKIEGPSLDVAGTYTAFPYNTHEITLGVMVDDGKGGMREQTEDALNLVFWHEFAHEVDQQDKITRPNRFFGPEARMRVSLAMGRASRRAVTVATIAGGVGGASDVANNMACIEGPLGLDRYPLLKLAFALGAAAAGSVVFRTFAKKLWQPITEIVHSTMHRLDPVERFANQHARIYARNFKAIRACDNQ